MKGMRIFYLDVISNSLGAMLFIFVAISAKNHIKPMERASGNLVVEVTTQEAGAEVGIYVRAPGLGQPYLFEDEIGDLGKTTVAGDLSRSTDRLFDVSRSIFVQADQDFTARTGSLARPSSALLKIHEPEVGCWEIGAYFIDRLDIFAADQETKVKLHVWYRGTRFETALPDADGNDVLRPRTVTWAAPGQHEVIRLEIPSGAPCVRQ